MGNFSKTVIGKGNADIFSLSSINAAAQRPATVGMAAVVYETSAAEPALPAEGFYINRHPVTWPDGFYLRTNLFYYSYKFMS